MRVTGGRSGETDTSQTRTLSLRCFNFPGARPRNRSVDDGQAGNGCLEGPFRMYSGPALPNHGRSALPSRASTAGQRSGQPVLSPPPGASAQEAQPGQLSTCPQSGRWHLLCALKPSAMLMHGPQTANALRSGSRPKHCSKTAFPKHKPPSATKTNRYAVKDHCTPCHRGWGGKPPSQGLAHTDIALH